MKAGGFLVSGNDVGVGKTMVGCALGFAFKVRGLRVGVMKPIETGCAERNGQLIAEDAAALAAAASSDLPADLVCQFRYRSALAPAAAAAADGAPLPSYEIIERSAGEVLRRADMVLIEDCGGLAVAIDQRHTFADLAAALSLEIIAVIANRGAFISATRLMCDYALRRQLKVVGFILNALNRDSSSSVVRDAELATMLIGVPCLGTVQFKEPLAKTIVERLLQGSGRLQELP